MGYFRIPETNFCKKLFLFDSQKLFINYDKFDKLKKKRKKNNYKLNSRDNFFSLKVI